MRLAFFIGKGGVGKTTCSAAYAAELARAHPRGSVLVVSTDPAHSLADVLQLKLGDRPQRVPLARARLFAWQLNASREFERFLAQQRDAILAVVENATIFSRADIEPLLDSTLPGMAEVAALISLHGLLQGDEYDHIVVDTAPLGHTLRLFQLPEHFARFLDFLETAASRDEVLAATFGGKRTTSGRFPFLETWSQMTDALRAQLSGQHARLFLVTTPEPFALAESERALGWLADAAPRLRVTDVVLNRAVMSGGGCPRCQQRAAATRGARASLRRTFKGAKLWLGDDTGSPVVGVAALASFGRHVFARGKPPTVAPPRAPTIRMQPAKWPRLAAPLTLTLGKGGVGKTTISASLAVHERAKSKKASVLVCSTDPAPSLDDVFATNVGTRPRAVLRDPQLLAMEFDAVGEFRKWSEGVRYSIERAMQAEVSGVHLDLSFDRRVLLALLDVVPPGVDEIFATFRIVDLLATHDRVVLDMAPTGHALELLRMPARLAHWARLLLKTLARHRTLPLAQDLAVEIAQVEQRARELLKLLADEKQARVMPVMLAEPLPDRETERLLAALDDIGLATPELIVNRVLLVEDVGTCPRCRRAFAWQQATLAKLGRRARINVLCAREQLGEVAGARPLSRFTRELWQPA